MTVQAHLMHQCSFVLLCYQKFQISAEAFPDNAHECGKANVARIVLYPGDVRFGGAAAGRKLRLREVLLFPQFLNKYAKFEGLKFLLIDFPLLCASFAILLVQMTGKRG